MAAVSLFIVCLIRISYLDLAWALAFLQRPSSFTRLSAHSFNGGKMKHIFSFDEKYCYNMECESAEAQQALADGTFYFKIDGQNGMVHVGGDGPNRKLTVYNRYDSRGKEIKNRSVIGLPQGKNPNKFGKHEYFYEEIKADSKVNRGVLDLVEKHGERLAFLDREWVSVEWVGRKFQQTPGVNVDVAMAIHSEQIVPEQLALRLRSYIGLRKYLLEECKDEPVEGFVIEHEGTYWKATTSGFVEERGEAENPYQSRREKAKAPAFWQ